MAANAGTNVCLRRVEAFYLATVRDRATAAAKPGLRVQPTAEVT